MKDVVFEPLSPKNWSAFEELMGERGGCGGCWCTAFRRPSKEYEANKGEGNKAFQKAVVDSGRPTGLIAFNKKEPIGWIALAPREDYIKIENSRTLKRIDDKPVWSITCFFVKKEYRKQGISKILIKGAIEHARKNKIKSLEAYPAVPYSDKVPAAFLWIGVLSAFEENGFKIVRQSGKSKAMVRLEV